MKNKTVLLTSAGVATAVNVISALRKSRHYNFKIIAVDMGNNSAGQFLADMAYRVPSIKDHSYLQKILKIISKHSVDFVFPLYSQEIALFAANAPSILESGAQLLIPDLRSIMLCDDKIEFLSFLDENNFSHPVTFPSHLQVTRFPVFIKPKSGSSSRNAYKIPDQEELSFYLRKFPDSVIQEFVVKKEYTVDCLVDNELRIIASVPRERICVKDGKSVVAKSLKNELIITEVHRLLSTLQIRGACNVQLFFDGQTVEFIEVNPRLAAGGLPLCIEAGVNIPEMMVRIADGERLDYQDFEDGVLMIRYLSDLFIRDGHVQEI